MSKKNTAESFRRKSIEIHGDFYDYSQVVYVNNKVYVTLICSQHGEFPIRPNDHTSGKGCPHCGRIKTTQKQSSTAEEFIEKARKIHGEKYDYSRIVYINAQTKIEIGYNGSWFWQTPNNHLNGHGSVEERNNMFADKYGWNTQQFINRAREVHGNRYQYDKVCYNGSHSSVTITCLKHGDFEQMAYCHINGEQGCPLCSNTFSSEHAQVCKFLDDLGIKYEINNKKLLTEAHPEKKVRELDIVIESHKLAIEYCGLYHHTEDKRGKTRHLEKVELSEKIGYRLLTIFSDEWMNKRDIVKSRLKHILGLAEKGIGARELTIGKVEWSDVRDFLASNHLQGSGNPPRISYGAFYNNKLVALMTFGSPRFNKSSEWEMLRFCTDDRSYPGIASRLLNAFIKEYNPNSIISYVDRRWSNGKLYENIGFNRINTSKPAFYVVSENYTKRMNRYNFTKDNEESLLTQKELIAEAGQKLIWDCGTFTYRWNKNI